MYTEMETTIEVWYGGGLVEVTQEDYLEDCASSVKWTKDRVDISVTIWF